MTTAPSTNRRKPLPLRADRPRGNPHASDQHQPASASALWPPHLVGAERFIDDPDRVAGRGRLGEAY
jgi:hypothetical protein